MRRSGKTTRLVDKAVQLLFEDGNVFIPQAGFLERRDNLGGYTKEQIEKMRWMVDDYEGKQSNKMQSRLRQILIKRLQSEHQGQFVEEKGKGGWFILRNDFNK